MEGKLMCGVHRARVCLERAWRTEEASLSEESVAVCLFLHIWRCLCPPPPQSFSLCCTVLSRTPLHYAAANGSYQCAVTLVTAGAGVNEADCKGCSPLHYAAASDTYRR